LIELATALLMQGCSVALTLLAGMRQHIKFGLWQPFIGGHVFVLLQAIGWMCYAICLLVGLMVLHNIQEAAEIYGGCGALSVMNIFAVTIINLSLAYFNPDDTDTSSAGAGASTDGWDDGWGGNLSFYEACMSTKTMVSVLLSVSGSLCLTIFDTRPDTLKSPIIVVSAALAIICASALTVSHGSSHPVLKVCTRKNAKIKYFIKRLTNEAPPHARHRILRRHHHPPTPLTPPTPTDTDPPDARVHVVDAVRGRFHVRSASRPWLVLRGSVA